MDVRRQRNRITGSFRYIQQEIGELKWSCNGAGNHGGSSRSKGWYQRRWSRALRRLGRVIIAEQMEI